MMIFTFFSVRDYQLLTSISNENDTRFRCVRDSTREIHLVEELGEVVKIFLINNDNNR